MRQARQPNQKFYLARVISAALVLLVVCALGVRHLAHKQLHAALEEAMGSIVATQAATTDAALTEAMRLAQRMAASPALVALAAMPEDTNVRATAAGLIEAAIDPSRFPAVALITPQGPLLLDDGPVSTVAEDWEQIARHQPTPETGSALVITPRPIAETESARLYVVAPVPGAGRMTPVVLAIQLALPPLFGSDDGPVDAGITDTFVLFDRTARALDVRSRDLQMHPARRWSSAQVNTPFKLPLVRLDPAPGASGEPVIAAWHPVGASGLVIGVERAASRALAGSQEIDRAIGTLAAVAGGLLLAVLGVLRVRAASLVRNVATRTARFEDGQTRFDALIELIPMGVLTLDEQGTITEINGYAEQVFESQDHELIGRPFNRLLTNPVDALDDEAGRKRVEVSGLTPQGNTIPLELSMSPASGLAGRTRLVIVNDIAEHKRLENALRRAIHHRRQSEHRQRLLLDTAGEGIFGLDAQRRVSFINPAAARMLGYRPDEILGHQLGKPPSGIGVCLSDCPLLDPASEETLKGETTLVRHDGSHFEAGYSLTALPEHEGAVVVFGDITPRKRIEASLLLAERVFQHINEGVLVADADGRILRVNRALCDMVGYTEDELIGQPRPPYQSGEHPPVFYQQMWDTLRAEGQWEGEIWNLRRDGQLFPTWQTIVAVTRENDRDVEYVSVTRDITEQRRSEQRIHRLAYFDNLTGLPNRELFFDRFAHAIQRAHRQNNRLALLFLDLDRFKNVNDGLGHPVGDQLLRAVAERLQRLVRGEDTIARLGGDEFTILLESAGNQDGIALVAQKVVEALSRPFSIENQALHIGTSVGISLFPLHGEDATTLVKHADAAMYQAKAAGRNNYQFYDRSMSSGSRHRMALETRLHRAIQNEEFILHYQPQYQADGQMIGVEALIRWRDPVRGMIPPGDFIPLAEDTGLIVPIGEWALRRACQQMAEWQTHGSPPIRLSVNLAGPQIVRGDIVATVDSVLKETALAPQLLELEVTETFVMDHVDQAVDILSGLRALGVRIAIDDFGTGHSSLATLKRLPADTLKIDRAFVCDLPDDRNDVAIARAIIAMARELALETVAEGVETEAQKRFLVSEGCDYFQGFMLARPLPPEAIEPLWGHLRHLGIAG